MKLKTGILFLITALLQFSQYQTSFAREYNSPDSRLGIGIQEKSQLTSHTARGNLNVTEWSNRTFSPANPATYGGLEYSSLKMGVSAHLMEIEYRDQVSNGENIALSYLIFGFPVNTDLDWGMAFGFTPYSHASYDLSLPTGDPGQRNRISGGGHLNKFFLGSSIGLFDGLTIGANASYLLGQYNRNDALEFTQDAGFDNVRTSWQASLGGFAFDGGMQYRHETDNGRFFQTAIAAEYPLEINGTENRFEHTYIERQTATGETEIEIHDTIAFNEDMDHSLILPPKYSFGIEGGRIDSWTAGAQINYQAWSDFEGLYSQTTLADEWELAVGASVIPDKGDFESYLRTVKYNFGMNYVRTLIEENNEQLERVSFSLGFDLPLPRTPSEIHLAGQAGTYINQDEARFNDNFIKFLVSFSLTERWFQDRRIN